MSPIANNENKFLIKRVAIYIRVSTEEQAKEGYSISAQKQRLKAFCIAQDWDIAGVYVDEGISAKDMNRPQLQQMIKDIEAGKIDCVLVYRLDRLTRSVLDLYQMLQVFEKHNCKFKSATEVFETTTAMGRMFITIVAAMAQWERENLGERVKMGMTEKVRQGKYVHNIRPFGYDLDLNTSTLTINEDEATIVRMIVDLYLNGFGANRVCRYLNDRQISTKDGNLWNDKPLMQILKNPLYKGTIRWADELVEDAVPAIIDTDTFNDIQRTIERRRSLQPKQVSSDYIFSGALKCFQCGHPMVGHKVYRTLASGEKAIYKNYRCLRKKNGECKGGKQISEISLENAFLSFLEQFDFSSAINEVAVSGESTINTSNEAERKESLLRDLDKLNQRKKKWQYAWSNDIISDDDFRDRMLEAREQEEDIQKQLKSLVPIEEITTDKVELFSILQDIRRNWEKLEDLDKKNIVQMVFKQVQYNYDETNNIFISDVDFFY